VVSLRYPFGKKPTLPSGPLSKGPLLRGPVAPVAPVAPLPTQHQNDGGMVDRLDFALRQRDSVLQRIATTTNEALVALGLQFVALAFATTLAGFVFGHLTDLQRVHRGKLDAVMWGSLVAFAFFGSLFILTIIASSMHLAFTLDAGERNDDTVAANSVSLVAGMSSDDFVQALCDQPMDVHVRSVGKELHAEVLVADRKQRERIQGFRFLVLEILWLATTCLFAVTYLSTR